MRWFIVLIIIYSSIYCTNKNENKLINVRKEEYKKLSLPDSLHYLKGNSLNLDNFNDKDNLKILVFYFHDDCKVCTIKRLYLWERLKKQEFKGAELTTYNIFCGEYQAFKRVIYPDTDTSEKVFLDTNYSIFNNNDINVNNARMKVMLLDENNRLLLNGDPVYSDEIKQQYLELINKRVNN